ncbi:MAG: ribonuclease HII [Candidatus Hodarchaeota archaeon]
MELIAGIDEAGRGPVFGPLVIAGVSFNKKSLRVLSEEGIKDSKQISAKKRIKLARIIIDEAEGHQILRIPPREIDAALKNQEDNLNKLEIRKIFTIIQNLKADIYFVDAVSNPDSFSSEFINYSREQKKACSILKNVQELPFYTGEGKVLDLTEGNKKIVVENKADVKYLVVGAASILAKVERDQAIEELSKKFGNLGSGYPSDPHTKEFLLRNKDNLNQNKFQELVRFQWKSVQNLVKKSNIRSLDAYFAND